MRTDNDLLREALIRDRNEQTKQMYLDKIATPGTTEPAWWRYEDNDPAWIAEHNPETEK